MFVLSSDITIGGFQFSGVNQVRIKRSVHSYVDTATIRLPSIGCIIAGNNSGPTVVITGTLFNDGDPVTIKLGYNGDLQTEFMGFVRRRDLGMPLEVECEGYSWQLRHNIINFYNKEAKIADMLDAAVAGTDVTVQCATDMTLGKVQITDGTGGDMINAILKATDGCLSAFFISPKVLWVGLAYTQYAAGNDVFGLGSVQYRLGYNVVKDNNLKERVIEDDPVKVVYNKKTYKGEHLEGFYSRTNEFARTHRKLLNHVAQKAAMRPLAKEKALKLNYSGYEGSINAFLQPYCQPGYTANVIDDRYPERNGVYLVDGVDVNFGMSGGRRTVEIGPKVGFGNE